MPDELRQLAISKKIQEENHKALRAMARPFDEHCFCDHKKGVYCVSCEEALERGIRLQNQELERLRAELEYYKAYWEPRTQLVLDVEKFDKFWESMSNPAPPNESMKKAMRSKPPWKKLK